jgi:hypothetical protein
MATERKTLVPFQLALLIVKFATGAYATGYFWLGSRTDWKSRASGQLQAIERSYGNPWLAKLFHPASWVEQRVRGIEIDLRDEPSIKLMGS